MLCRSIMLLAVVAAAIACGGGTPVQGAGAARTGLENGSFTVDLNGVPIHYEVHGSGPVLMTVPNSWGLSLDGLRALYRPLEERLTMVYFDPRGMGGSGAVREEADMGMAAVRGDFDALRKHVGLERVAAIGWSNGAMNLILLASEDPETLPSAIFVHGAASFTPEDSANFAADHPELVADWATLDHELGAGRLSDEERTVRMKAFWLERYFPTATADPTTAAPLLQQAFAQAKFSWPHADLIPPSAGARYHRTTASGRIERPASLGGRGCRYGWWWLTGPKPGGASASAARIRSWSDVRPRRTWCSIPRPTATFHGPTA